MSAIAKPMAHFTSAVTADQNKFVPVEYVESVEARTITPTGGTTQYQLYFTLVFPQSGTKDVIINFPSSATMTTSLTNYKSAYSAAVAGT